MREDSVKKASLKVEWESYAPDERKGMRERVGSTLPSAHSEWANSSAALPTLPRYIQKGEHLSPEKSSRQEEFSLASFFYP